MLSEKLRKSAVVAVNEYDPVHSAIVGHTNITFYYHGIDQGTYGFNTAGRDINGKFHKASGFSVTWRDDIGFRGGVFDEGHKKACMHYVIVSEANYRSMQAYARSQAKLTTVHPPAYKFLKNNCADFVYLVFQHSDLTPEQKDIYHYLEVWNEAVAHYAGLSQGYYHKVSVHDTTESRTSSQK